MSNTNDFRPKAGSLLLLDTITFSSASPNITLSNLSGYSTYKLVYSGVKPISGSVYLRLKVGTLTVGYMYQLSYASSNVPAPAGFGSSVAGYMLLGKAHTSGNANGHAYIAGLSSIDDKVMYGQSSAYDEVAISHYEFGGAITSSLVLDTINISTDGVDMLEGTFKVYGIV